MARKGGSHPRGFGLASKPARRMTAFSSSLENMEASVPPMQPVRPEITFLTLQPVGNLRVKHWPLCSFKAARPGCTASLAGETGGGNFPRKRMLPGFT